jgi:calcineurin-like phosphoesterase family protein
LIRIGIISDTHGLLRREAIEQLTGADHIIHARDIGAAEVIGEINAALRGHYAYYGVAGNLRSLVIYRVVERYWRRMLCSRSWAGRRLTWDAFDQIKERTPLLPPKLRLRYSELQALAVL